MADNMLIFNIFAFLPPYLLYFALKRLNLQNITNMAHGVAYFESLCFNTATDVYKRSLWAIPL